MTTEMILPIAETIDAVGYDAVEVMAGGDLKKCVRDLKDDPWQRLRLLGERLKKTPTRFIRGRNMGVFQIVPDAVEELWTERMAANGVCQMRISDSSNTPAGWELQVKTARKYGLGTIVNLIYTLSPRHTDEYYAEKTRLAAALSPDRLCLKDPGALITPERVRTLVPVVLANAGTIPVEFHTHSLTGLGSMCYFEAIKLGIRCVNTAVPPLANGASNPSVYTTIANARAIGVTPSINEDLLPRIESHFRRIAEREGFPTVLAGDYDHAQYLHQVPGGMISNFRFQLSKIGMLEKLPAILEETARVRAELGHPIMVTPYSQFVGSQAAINIVAGERYKVITDEVIHYALGLWGEDESNAIDADIKDRILSSPRARELAKYEIPQPSLKEVRRQYGGQGVSDEEMLLRIATDKGSVDAMKKAYGVGFGHDGETEPLVKLVHTLSKYQSIRHVQMQAEGLSITLRQG